MTDHYASYIKHLRAADRSYGRHFLEHFERTGVAMTDPRKGSTVVGKVMVCGASRKRVRAFAKAFQEQHR